MVPWVGAIAAYRSYCPIHSRSDTSVKYVIRAQDGLSKVYSVADGRLGLPPETVKTRLHPRPAAAPHPTCERAPK